MATNPSIVNSTAHKMARLRPFLNLVLRVGHCIVHIMLLGELDGQAMSKIVDRLLFVPAHLLFFFMSIFS